MRYRKENEKANAESRSQRSDTRMRLIRVYESGDRIEAGWLEQEIEELRWMPENGNERGRDAFVEADQSG